MSMTNVAMVDLAAEETVQAGIAGVLRLNGHDANPTEHDKDVARGYVLAVLAGIAHRND